MGRKAKKENVYRLLEAPKGYVSILLHIITSQIKVHIFVFPESRYAECGLKHKKGKIFSRMVSTKSRIHISVCFWYLSTKAIVKPVIVYTCGQHWTQNPVTVNANFFHHQSSRRKSLTPNEKSVILEERLKVFKRESQNYEDMKNLLHDECRSPRGK